MTKTPAFLLERLSKALHRDRHRLRRALQRVSERYREGAIPPEELDPLVEQLENSVATCERRRAEMPTPKLDESLPIFERREEIEAALREHPVTVVSGATGSGKSTQLPLIALAAGFGITGLIGHTQPRRIAARGVAARIASQLGTPLGREVGFKIRFADQTSDQTYIKLMTDGILLAETQSDRFLDQYELLIVDEAHERSLNIDFLLGYLKNLLRRRRNLKLVITSATIDTEKFANHFSVPGSPPVPIIDVEGRTYPVDIEYSPPTEELEGRDEESERGVIEACQSLAARGDGDILVFLPTEADIRGLNRKMKGLRFGRGNAEIVPLYARLSTEQQNQIFEPHSGRRIVLATNVAESSITVPGIRYVVDTGTARISRYAPRSKVQRLPIEPISQASANQRSGRCGRVAPGICIRLYSQEDYESRSVYTTPEIRRTNLASVILQTLTLRLGDIREFPFIDPPTPEAIRDGYKTLYELGAVDETRRVTPLGRKLARLPVDPRIGRMIHQADEEQCLAEILIIASSLEIQDPRVRPPDRQQAADQKHAQFADPQSDFLARLKLWDFFHQLKEDLSRSRLRTACQQNFLNYSLLRQWQEIHRQLKSMVREQGLQVRPRRDDYTAIHRSLLAGLLSGVALRGERHEFTGAGGIQFHLWPGSGVFDAKPNWVVVAELIETSRRYGRTVARVEPDWIESLAPHLLKHDYSDPHWSRKQQTVMAHERVSLFGLPIVASRRTGYTRIEPEVCREIFIEQALAGGEYRGKGKFYAHNEALLEEIRQEAAKTRNRELVVDSWLVAGFYDQRLPAEVTDTRSLQKWLSQDPRHNEQLCMTRADLLDETAGISPDLFPDQVQLGAMQVPVEYAFEPGSERDGATVEIPLAGLGQVDDIQTGWLIPGLLRDRVVGLIRSLPKSIRRNLVPAPETAERVVAEIEFGTGSFLEAVARHLTRLGGLPVTVDQFRPEKVEAHLNLNLRVVDDEGVVVAEGRSLAEIRSQLGPEFASNVVETDDSEWHGDGLRDWEWDTLPTEITIHRGATRLAAYPAIVDQGEAVGLRLVDSRAAAERQTAQGLMRLLRIRFRRAIKSQVAWLPQFDHYALLLSRTLPPRELRDQLGDLLVRIALVDNRPVPRDRGAWDALQNDAVERIGMAAQELARWLPGLAENYHAASLAIEELPSRYDWAKGDLREQLKNLTGEDFLRRVPWIWLRQYPRFLQAIAVRCEKLATSPTDRDREAQAQVREFWQRFLDREGAHRQQAIVDPALEKFRWMLEEFRVSLFAQQLGTSMKVSGPRLEKQWDQVRHG